MGKNRDRKDIESALKSKGFEKVEKSNHRAYVFEHEDLKRSVFTIISRGSSYKVYGAKLLSQMSTQLNLTNSQLLDLIDCPMDKSDYIEALRARDVLS